MEITDAIAYSTTAIASAIRQDEFGDLWIYFNTAPANTKLPFFDKAGRKMKYFGAVTGANKFSDWAPCFYYRQ
jgi:hypothetical protein